MGKYIDAEKLKAEIKHLEQLNEISDDEDYAQYELDVACGYDMACKEIFSSITSLQQEQPEVDLKKEIKEWTDLMVGASFPEQDGDFISEEDYRSAIRQTAIHFLGLNARKEEK